MAGRKKGVRMKKARKLAKEHWKWVNRMLKETDEPKGNVKTIGVYYRAAFIHGYKHAKEKEQ